MSAALPAFILAALITATLGVCVKVFVFRDVPEGFWTGREFGRSGK